ncbi:Aminopeptidase PepS [Sporomusa ovata DSM 2662]|uniref:Aminopeptidase n=1 Tax=Sporomusa ovata TaxID=2378 RepID=A0A0U1KWT1_9FIRM|nr:aminopeptidase [Sporomusa ovata]EQB28756.1 peptidase M29, aminopeptidase II [Sporomusa ovata DSM 2662]CQR71908.1 aminopeptidase [Sporomusa ovata]
MDPRVKTLAQNLIGYSTSLAPGEKILIEMFDDALPLAKALVDEAYAAGGIPFLEIKNSQLQRSLLRKASGEQFALVASWEQARMKEMNAYIAIRASFNIAEMADVSDAQLQSYQQNWVKPVHLDVRVPHTKWCILRWPNASMAQLSNSSTEAFEDFYFQVCNLDYAKMAKAMDPLIALMEKTDKVKITGPDTELTFSIKGIPAVKCSGLRNIPDGEVYTAPVRESVNGVLSYNTPSVYQGFTYENIRLEFKNGKIIKATANDSEKINKVFDIDEGARYIGEFALGVNPYIEKPMKDILFDEKIKGSFHFTPGNAYDAAFNGNKSVIHWDLVCIQTAEYGGGEIWFDDKLIRKDGQFVRPELAGLNPESLL